MKNNKSNINIFTVFVILLMTLGLNGCSSHHDKTPRIRIQDFVEKEVIDGNLGFRNKITRQKMEVVKCGSRYEGECPSTKAGFKPIGTQTLKARITAFEKDTNSVKCFILIEIRDYAPIKIEWEEDGETCSVGQEG